MKRIQTGCTALMLFALVGCQPERQQTDATGTGTEPAMAKWWAELYREAETNWPSAARRGIGPSAIKVLLPEYTNATPQDDRYSVMLPDGSWWISARYRLRSDLDVTRDEIYDRLRDAFSLTENWRVTTRATTNFGAGLIRIGEDDLWCELIPYFGSYDQDTWCVHVSDDAREVCAYSRSYWGIGRKKPEAPTTASTTTNQSALRTD